jgi:hypothetical protein
MMNARDKVVVKEIQCDLMPVVLNLIAMSVRQARKSAHPHSHRKVLSLPSTKAQISSH